MIAASAVPQSSPAPLVSVVLLYAATLAAALLADRNWLFFVFLAALAFAVINPILCAFGHAWWRDTLLSAVGFFGTFVMVGALANADIIPMREDVMGMVGPVLIYLGAVPASGLLRLLLRMWRQPA
jgi:hypothetical protein